MKIINKKLKVGVVGLGHQSLKDHIPAVKMSQDVDLVGVVDTDEKKLNFFLKENKNIKGYNNLDHLFKKESLDFIIIAVPHYAHYKITKKALLKKIHVLKEKPFAISLKQAKKLRNIAKKNSVEIMTVSQRKFSPVYSSFFQLINKIGKPFYIEIRYTFFIKKPYEGWRGKKKLAGGGCLIDMGYHMIDLLMWYFGLPDEIFAETSSTAKENVSYDTEDTANVIFRYKTKKLWGSLLISRVIPPKQEYFNIYGTKGIIHIERGKIERRSSNGKLQELLKQKGDWSSVTQSQLQYFVNVIRGKNQNISNPEFHFNHLAFIEAAYKSKKTNKYINPKSLL